jgi:hypothetical protein
MKKLLTLTAYALLIWMITFVSCRKELECYDCNQPPVANAGADQKITLPKDSVVLNGSASVDPDGKINGWAWTKISGPASSTITNAAMAITVVKNLTAGIYQFELKVTDDKGMSSKDTVQVILVNPAVNQPPVANAGPDQTISCQQIQYCLTELNQLILITTLPLTIGAKYPGLHLSALQIQLVHKQQ